MWRRFSVRNIAAHEFLREPFDYAAMRTIHQHISKHEEQDISAKT
jgi:hypothetical protein